MLCPSYTSVTRKKKITYLGRVEVKLLKHAIEYEKYSSSSVKYSSSSNESRHLPRDSSVNESSFIFVIISLILGIYSLC